jgi:hypothetical protein
MAEYWKSAVSHFSFELYTVTTDIFVLYSLDSGANNARSSFATRHSRRPNTKPVPNTKVASSASCAIFTETMNNNKERHSVRKVRSNGYGRPSQAVPRKAIPTLLHLGRRPPRQQPNLLIDRSALRRGRNRWHNWLKWV